MKKVGFLLGFISPSSSPSLPPFLPCLHFLRSLQVLAFSPAEILFLPIFLLASAILTCFWPRTLARGAFTHVFFLFIFRREFFFGCFVHSSAYIYRTFFRSSTIARVMGSTTMLAWVLFGGLAFGAQPGVTLTPAQIAAQTAASRENSDFRYLDLLVCSFACLHGLFFFF